MSAHRLASGADREAELPRVVIVNGEPFSGQCATGLTLRALFAGWPADRLACIHLSEYVPDEGACVRYWRLSASDRVPVRVANDGGGKAAALNTAGACASQASQGVVSRVVAAGRALARKHYVSHLAHYRLTPVVLDEIASFAPHVIYSMLGSNALLRLVLDVRERCAVPIVPHIMDDWLGTLYQRSVLRALLRRRMMEDWARVLRFAPVRLTIGQDMADEYERRYGGTFTPFMNAIEPSLLSARTTRRRCRGEPFRLCYVGGLHLGRWQSLLDIGAALEVLSRGGMPAELCVYTQPQHVHLARRLESSAVIRVLGAVQPAAVPDVLRRADVLVHVESFEAEARAYTRYSLSTKLPECMGVARPILAYGPEELASIRYVHASGAGVVVGVRRHDLLVERIRCVLASRTLRERMGNRGFSVAAERHDAQRQRERFRAVMKKAAEGER